jgi:hypothetical protein
MSHHTVSIPVNPALSLNVPDSPVLSEDTSELPLPNYVAPASRPVAFSDGTQIKHHVTVSQGLESGHLSNVSGSFTDRLSYRDQDEFFHCMLSYRVNSEGPPESQDKCRNDMARLIWQTCSTCSKSWSPNKDSPLDTEIPYKLNHHCLYVVGRFGIWPKVFPNPTSPIRLFLDQKNLRPGVDWKGTGNREDGGFLGALSSSLMFVPLLSATPARFKIVPTGEKDRFKSLGPINISVPKDGDSLNIFCDASYDIVSDAQLAYTCSEFRLNDGSFIIKSSSGTKDCQAVNEQMMSSALFWTPKCILPSDGSGPRGSVSEMLTIMHKSENLTFRVIERPSPELAVLQVDQLSDHVFFKNETIELDLHREHDALQPVGVQSKFYELRIESVKIQGSIDARINSIIVIRCGEYSNRLRLNFANEPSIRGMTVSDERSDRKDNVLMEFMLSRALHLALELDTNPHPCKLIMPVFVDDIHTILAVSHRLSSEVSNKTAIAVQDSLQKILNRTLSVLEEKKWIRVSVKGAVQFMADLQGLQLSNTENLLKTMESKAELVCSSIISTIGIEAEMYCLNQYVSNNPLADELLDFIKKQNIGHIRPSLVRSDVTSINIFSQLSSKSVELIAQDSCEVSKRPLVKEITDIEIAVQAAKASPYNLPVSQRLAKFQDEEASFMTIAYSTYAMEQVLVKPFFNRLNLFCAIFISFLCAYQFYQGEFTFAIVNVPRSIGIWSIVFCVHVLKSVKLGRLAFFFGFISTAIACILGVLILDKLENGSIQWNKSIYCSKNYDTSQFSTCVVYQYSYNFWQAFYWISLAVLIRWRQEFVWRCGMSGASIMLILSLAFEIILGTPKIYDYAGVIVFPSLLVGTELLKFYGTLQAIRLTKESKQVLSRAWREVKKDHKKLGSLTELVEFVDKACHHCPFVIDRSKGLGKWKDGNAATAPPLIHQPTSDFDELYGRAISFNDAFQQWIESFFIRNGDPSRFLHIKHEETKSGQIAFRIPNDYANKLPFKGDVDRGPVKRPHRSIAKVLAIAARLCKTIAYSSF